MKREVGSGSVTYEIERLKREVKASRYASSSDYFWLATLIVCA
jgi:hypothetical protein